MRKLLWIAPIAFFFVNPSVGCGSDDPQFQYGAAEMRTAVEGEWSFIITPSGGSPAQVTVNISQATAVGGSTASASNRMFVRAAYACGTRTLVNSAGACIDVSEMPLTVSYVSGDASFSDAMMSGRFRVASLIFLSGDLELTVGPYQILLQVNADGSLFDPHLGPRSSTGSLTVTRI